MKRKLLFFVTLTIMSMSLFTAIESRAGFVVKQPASKVIATNAAKTETTAITTTSESVTTSAEVKTHHSFFHKVFSKIGGLAKKAKVSQLGYIILAIFWLGWLAIGINDDWSGSKWIISLILYLLFWLPGFIYTLVVMGNYY